MRHPPRDRGDANISSLFRAVVPGITPGTYHAESESESTSTTYSRLSVAIRTYADGFLAIVARHTPTDGGFAEQFDKASGAPASAADLSWSYVAVLSVRGRIGPVAFGVQRIWKSSVEPPGYRSKDGHLRCILMYIDGGPITGSHGFHNCVKQSREKAGLGLGITLTGYRLPL